MTNDSVLVKLNMVKNMEKNFKKILKIIMIPEILFILLGVYLYLYEELTAVIMSYLITTFIIVKGIAFIKTHFYNNKKLKLFELNIPYGILNIAYAIILVINIFTLRVDLNVLVGFYIIATSLIYIYVLIKLKKISKQSKILLSCVSGLITVFGVILSFNILSDILFFSNICGITFIFYGILNIMALKIIKKNMKKNR